MKLNIYQIDAFANFSFEGNPAAICPLQEWLPDSLMQSIAEENNLSETAFFVPTKKGFHIRWFTPLHEVELCGHATLASAYVIFNILEYKEAEIEFDSQSGPLKVRKNNDWLEMDFPSQSPIVCEPPQALLNAFEDRPVETLKFMDYIVVFENESSVINALPDLKSLEELDLRAVIITSKASEYDFVTRCFAPKYGINEDPVTGSSFTQLVPYWSGKLNKNILSAKQISKRGGEVKCVYAGERVKISGKAVQYMQGVIEVNI